MSKKQIAKQPNKESHLDLAFFGAASFAVLAIGALIIAKDSFPSFLQNTKVLVDTSELSVAPNVSWRCLNGIHVVDSKNIKPAIKSTFLECESLCLNLDECAAFSWKDEQCWLKSDIEPLEYDKPSTKTSLKVFSRERTRTDILNEPSAYLLAARQNIIGHAVMETLRTLSNVKAKGLKPVIPEELSTALGEHSQKLASLIEENGDEKETTELRLLVAYVRMFVDDCGQAKEILSSAMKECNDANQQAAIRTALSFIAEVDGDHDAHRMRRAAMVADPKALAQGNLSKGGHPFNRSFDNYLGLHEQAYATGQAMRDHYRSTLLMLFSYRRLWQHQVREKGVDAWTEIFGPRKIVTEGSPGFYIAAGADREEIRKAHVSFSQSDFVILRDLVTPWEVSLLANYYRSCLKPVYGGHDPNLGRTSAYNDRINYHLNSDLRPLIEHILGFHVQVSYSFMCHYEFYKGVPASTRVLQVRVCF